MVASNRCSAVAVEELSAALNPTGVPTFEAVGTRGVGVFGVAKSQDAFGPIARTVYDAATGLETLAGKSYVSGLSTSLAA